MKVRSNSNTASPGEDPYLIQLANGESSEQNKVRRMFSIKTILEDFNENELSSQA